MTQTSYGFNGQVNDLAWSKYAAMLTHGRPSTLTVSDLTLQQVASTRSITVAPGTIAGNGVATTLDATETIVVPIPTNGQWHLLVLNRVWGTSTTSLQLRAGATTATAVPTALPASYPATFATNHGVNSDIPIAWLWVTSANTNVLRAPIVLPHEGLNPRRGTTSQRGSWYGLGGAGAGLTDLWLSGIGEWYNIDGEWTERYLPARASTGSGDPGRPAGWYPVIGHMPSMELGGSTGNNIPSSSTTTMLGFAVGDRSNWGGVSYAGNGLWTLTTPGRWLISAVVQYAPGNTSSRRELKIGATGVPAVAMTSNDGALNAGYLSVSGEYIAGAASNQFYVSFYQNTGATLLVNVISITAVYLGPA